MKGLIGKKIGMTSIFDAAGNQVNVTVIDVTPNIVTQVKTEATDGYNAVQLGYGERKEKNTSAPLKGHFAKNNITPKAKLAEFRDFDFEKAPGETVSVDIFQEGERVSVVGTSKGKGFQGVVKRHGFSGVGMGSHGQHNRLRAPGSMGASSWPSRVLKGLRMAGRMGGERVKTRNLAIAKIMADKNLLFIEGSVPGHNNSFVLIEKY
jgi:large subunit ribosomal protein L3